MTEEEALQVLSKRDLSLNRLFSKTANGGYMDFTRCERSNGTFYGTAGVCRLGVESEKTVELSAKVSKVIDSYADELKKVWPAYTKDQLISAASQLIKDTEKEHEKSLAGNVTKEEVSDFLNEFQLPVLSAQKKFLVVGMEPGKATDDYHSDFATDLATFKLGKNLNDLELAMAAQMIVRSVKTEDQFAKNVVGLDAKNIRGNSYAKQLAKVISTDLRPEQLYMSLGRGNVRAVAALGVNSDGVYKAINEQKDPSLKRLGRKETGALAEKRTSAILDALIKRGKDKDFQGGLFAPGANAEAKATIASFVSNFKSKGGKVVEYTTYIGSKGDMPVKTYSLQLENGTPFVILESSITKMSIAGKILTKAYNDTITNFIKETR